MSSVNASLNSLRELAPALNKAADDAAKIMQEAENLLTKELSIGVVAEVYVNELSLSPKKTLVTRLSHCRVDGKFRIAVLKEIGTGTAADQAWTWEEKELTPWAECPRDVKLETFPSLPDLLEEIIKEATKAKDNVEKTTATVRQILGIGKTSGEPTAGKSDGNRLIKSTTPTGQSRQALSNP